jgi:hypothetical protein
MCSDAFFSGGVNYRGGVHGRFRPSRRPYMIRILAGLSFSSLDEVTMTIAPASFARRRPGPALKKHSNGYRSYNYYEALLHISRVRLLWTVASGSVLEADRRWVKNTEAIVVTRQEKITLGEMRAMGVRGLLVYCADYKCAHLARITGDRWPDYIRVSDLEESFVCQVCGARGAHIRPDFDWDKKPSSKLTLPLPAPSYP